MKNRIDWTNVVLVLGVLATLVLLVLLGPPEHRTVAAASAVGLVGVVSTALRGRLIKRDPSKFAPKPPPKEEAKDDQSPETD